MAVLRIPAIAPVPGIPVLWPGPGRGPAARLARIFTAPLPEDIGDEVTVAALFRASQALNFLTGGRAEMTFSARCHLARRRSRGPARLGWTLTARGIDAACAMLRGECEHCAAAWGNYRARTRRRG